MQGHPRGELVTLFQSPTRMHDDADNLFNSEQLLSYATHRDIMIRQCAGEAHWHNGVVERHIQTLTAMIQKM